MVTKNSICKYLRSSEEINMTNESFISTSIKTGIVLHLITKNNKKKREEINQIAENIFILKSVHMREDLSKLFCIREKESCFSIFT